MNIFNIDFEFICNIDPIRNSCNIILPYDPKSLYVNSKNIPLHQYGNGPFCKFQIDNTVKDAGIYVIVVSSNLKYIGETGKLAERFNVGYGNISPRNCFRGGQSTNCRINHNIYNAIKKGEQIELYFFKTQNYKQMELEILQNCKLEWNIKDN